MTHTLHFRVIHPPTPDIARTEMTFDVPLLDSTSVGDILQVETILNRITGVRFHLSVSTRVPVPATAACSQCGAQIPHDLLEYNTSGTVRLCPVCATKESR